MKYLFVILDGACDRPLKALDLRTPLIVAAGDTMKAMVRKSRVGAVRTLPEGWTGDPEAALMSLMGYDPTGVFTGRGPLDAAALEIGLDRTDIAFRAHLVATDGHTLTDPTAGNFPAEQGRVLMQHVEDRLGVDAAQFFPDGGFRHVFVWREGPDGLACTSPYDAVGQPLRGVLPTGDHAERLTRLLWDTAEVLADHPINRRRKDDGKPTADMVWPWSPGRVPKLDMFGFRHGVGGTCVAANPLVRGLARLSGLQVVQPPGATGSLDTDYGMKARAALRALRDGSFCLVHIEAPNEAGLAGDWEAKLDSLRRIEERFFVPILDRIGQLDDFRILVTVDHATPCEDRRAVPGWMPFFITGSREKAQGSQPMPFDERAAEEAPWRIPEGRALLPELFLDPD